MQLIVKSNFIYKCTLCIHVIYIELTAHEITYNINVLPLKDFLCYGCNHVIDCSVQCAFGTTK